VRAIAVSAQTGFGLDRLTRGIGGYARVRVGTDEGPALTPDEQLRLQADLGNKPLLLLRNHGMLAAGGSVSEAFLLTYHFHHGMKQENRQWLKDSGYVVARDGKDTGSMGEN